MISLAGLATLVIYVLIAGLIFWLLYWLVGYVGLPEPFNKVARIVLAVASVIFLIFLLLSLVSDRPMFRP